MARKISVEIVGDARSLEKAFKKSSRSANGPCRGRADGCAFGCSCVCLRLLTCVCLRHNRLDQHLAFLADRLVNVLGRHLFAQQHLVVRLARRDHGEAIGKRGDAAVEQDRFVVGRL